MLPVFLFTLNQHLECRVLEIEYSTQIEGYDFGLCLLNSQPDLVRKLFGVGEEDSSFGPEYQQTWEGFVFRMFLGARPEHVCARLASEHVQPRIRNLVSKRHN